MYSYYACSALKIYWPNWARKIVTALQLSQMVFGLGILTTVWVHCPYDPNLLMGGFLMYFSYFVLFLQFFTAKAAKAPRSTTTTLDQGPKTE